MRGVLGQVSAGTAEKILDSANPREIRALQKAISAAAKMKENTASMTRKHKFLDGNRKNLCVKEFRQDCVPPVREKKRMDIRETIRDCRGHK